MLQITLLKFAKYYILVVYNICYNITKYKNMISLENIWSYLVQRWCSMIWRPWTIHSVRKFQLGHDSGITDDLLKESAVLLWLRFIWTYWQNNAVRWYRVRGREKLHGITRLIAKSIVVRVTSPPLFRRWTCTNVCCTLEH